MRLIDADALKDTLLKYHYTTEHNQIFRYIDEQPTAYEADAVVAELEMKIDNAEFDEMLSRDEKDVYMDAYRRAIEIVKGGGVNGKKQIK